MDICIDHLMKHLAYLASPKTMGRLSGTEGAKRTAIYLADELRSMGYKPIDAKQDFFQSVGVPATRLLGSVRLEVDGKEFKHRTDYAELLTVSSGGEAEGILFVLKDGDDVEPSELEGKIVLIPERPEGFDVKSTVTTALAFGVKGLLIEFGEPKWFSKTLLARKTTKSQYSGSVHPSQTNSRKV